MSDPLPTDNRRFEIALRITGREVVALSLLSSTANQRWLWISLGAVATVAVGFLLYGADVGAIYKGFWAP